MTEVYLYGDYCATCRRPFLSNYTLFQCYNCNPNNFLSQKFYENYLLERMKNTPNIKLIVIRPNRIKHPICILNNLSDCLHFIGKLTPPVEPTAPASLNVMEANQSYLVMFYDSKTSGYNPVTDHIESLSWNLIRYFRGVTKFVEVSSGVWKHGDPLCEQLQKDLELTELLVAHNVDFERKFLPFEYNGKTYCTMRDTRDIAKIAKKDKHGYKKPKLGELYRALFGKDWVDNRDTTETISIIRECWIKIMEDRRLRISPL